MPRFVLLEHDAPTGLHWDFMLEEGDQLATWSLPSVPKQGATLVCHQLGGHRVEYLEYEGPVSRGRGQVSRVDRGEFQWIDQKADRLEIEVKGDALDGRIVLAQEKQGGESHWRLTYEER